jgi:hypothetical protein
MRAMEPRRFEKIKISSFFAPKVIGRILGGPP